MNKAVTDEASRASDADPGAIQGGPSVTIDLSREDISTLPDEVVDVIKDRLGR